jgi:hypothetical protein
MEVSRWIHLQQDPSWRAKAVDGQGVNPMTWICLVEYLVSGAIDHLQTLVFVLVDDNKLKL